MNNSPAFNFVQQVFALNMFSNLVSDKKGSDTNLQIDLQNLLGYLLPNTTLQQEFLSTWTVVWGPQVGSYGMDEKKPGKEVVTNAMYVATNGNGQYVVAVSATNPVSKYGWFVEDFDVRGMVPWSTCLPSQLQNIVPASDICVSNGTSIGLAHLLSLTDPKTSDTLVAYLQSVFQSSIEPATVVVSGHSLGGALSSVLALYLQQTLTTWNTAQTVKVSAMPTAGACPGNKAFSDYHNSIMGTTTVRFWNKLDPVPHGWEPNMLEQVPFLYYPYLQPGFLLKGITALALSQSLIGAATGLGGGQYTQLEPQTPPLPGQVGISATRNLTPAEVLECFLDMAAEDILNAINVPPHVIPQIIAEMNALIQQAVTVVTMQEFLANIETYLVNILGQQQATVLIQILTVLLEQIENVALFLIQLGLQHVSYYPDLMGTANMHPLTQAIINKNTEDGALSADYVNRMDSLLDPKKALKVFTVLSDKVIQLMTPEFLTAHGMGQMLSN